MNKKVIIGVLVALAVLLGGLYFIKNDSEIAEDNSVTILQDVTIGYSALRISLPVFVAQERGYFTEEGLNVDLERFDTAQPLMSALASGAVQVAGYTALPITYNVMLRSGTDMYFATSMLEDQDHRISYLIVPSDTPEEFSVKDLVGKKIGILPTIAYKAWIEQILLANDVSLDSVELVQIAPALTPSALESGQVDALFTNDPAATTVLEQGIGRLMSERVEVPATLGDPFLFGSFNIRKDFADSNPEITNSIVKALDKAVIFTNENPTEAKELMKSYLHESQQPFVNSYPDALYGTTKDANEVTYQEIADKYLEIGIIPEAVSVTGLVITGE